MMPWTATKTKKCVNGMDYCRRSIAGQMKSPSDGSMTVSSFFDSHSVSVLTVSWLSFTIKNLSCSGGPNALINVVATDTALSRVSKKKLRMDPTTKIYQREKFSCELFLT